MYESEDQEVLLDEDGGEAAAIQNAKALEFLRDAAETAVLCASYLATGEQRH